MFFFFREILLLHHIWYYFNMPTPYVLALDVVFYWPLAIELSTWSLPFLVDIITCLEMVQGNHRVFVITIQKCKYSILQLILVRFDRYHQYVYPLIIISFSSIRDSGRYRAIIWNSGTPFWKVIVLYFNYYYYGYICLNNFILIPYYWVSVFESISIEPP